MIYYDFELYLYLQRTFYVYITYMFTFHSFTGSISQNTLHWVHKHSVDFVREGVCGGSDALFPPSFAVKGAEALNSKTK